MKNKQINFNIVKPEYQRTEFINFCNENQLEIKSLSEVLINELSSGNKNFSDTNFSSYGELFDFSMANFAVNPLNAAAKALRGKKLTKSQKRQFKTQTPISNRPKPPKPSNVGKAAKSTDLTRGAGSNTSVKSNITTKAPKAPSSASANPAASTYRLSQAQAAKFEVKPNAPKTQVQAPAPKPVNQANQANQVKQAKSGAPKVKSRKPAAPANSAEVANMQISSANGVNGAIPNTGAQINVNKPAAPKAQAQANAGANGANTQAAKAKTAADSNAYKLSAEDAAKVEVKPEDPMKSFKAKVNANKNLTDLEKKSIIEAEESKIAKQAQREANKKLSKELDELGVSGEQKHKIFEARANAGANKAATGDAAKPAYERKINTGVDAAAARYQNMLKAVQKAKTPEQAKALQTKADNLRKAYIAQFNAAHKRQIAGFHSDVDQIKRFGFGDWWKHNPIEGTAKLAVPGAVVAYGGYKATGGGSDD